MLKFSSKKYSILLTQGDEDGICPEIIAKALLGLNFINFKIFIICIQSVKEKIINLIKKYEVSENKTKNTVLHNYSKLLDKGYIEFINPLDYQIPKDLKESGELSSIYLANHLLLNKKADILVTAPVNKHKLAKHLKGFTGHTNYLKEISKSKNTLMLMSSLDLKVALLTEHLAIKKVSESISREKLTDAINLLSRYCKKMNYKDICILGLNPHSGDNGLVGSEEEEIIKPCISKYKNSEVKIYGPLPADTAFTKEIRDRHKVFLSMYHDQAMIAVKYKGLDNVVNISLGLPYIRTSPGHGTAYNIAGKDIASSKSLINSIYEAVKTHITYYG